MNHNQLPNVHLALFSILSSCISSCLFILIPITCCFGFMPYLIASSFLLNSFSYLIIPPTCPTMPRWSFCPPTYLFCCLLPYLFHCIPFAIYIVSFKYLIFSLLPNEQILALRWALSASILHLALFSILSYLCSLHQLD